MEGHDQLLKEKAAIRKGDCEGCQAEKWSLEGMESHDDRPLKTVYKRMKRILWLLSPGSGDRVNIGNRYYATNHSKVEGNTLTSDYG